MPTTARRMKAVRFFDELYELIYQAEPQDASYSTVLYEVWAREIISGGRAGLTPAALSKIHHLPKETARRRLRAMEKKGFLVKRDQGYFLPEDAPYQETFDKFVKLLENYTS